MPRVRLFVRLMIRPLFKEPVRTALTVLAIALGVGVVLGIELSGDAAAGSFHSSMETLSGKQDLEISAGGGIPETVLGTLSALPYPLSITARLEDFAVLVGTKQTLPLIGIDLIGELNNLTTKPGTETSAGVISGCAQSKPAALKENILACLGAAKSIWVGASLQHRPGEHLALLINDQEANYLVQGVYPDSNGAESAIIMDIAAAQRALGRIGRVDRVLIKLPPNGDLETWRKQLRAILPGGVEVNLRGTATSENRQMLAAFRWNLRLLSYISLVVGAFLIYNTISVSVVRRRPEIGIVRALGASRALVITAFLGEAASLGVAGALLGVPLGRFMAAGAVKLMGATVQSLYVSSSPGSIELTASSLLTAFVVGIGVAVASAGSPAREAAQVSPVQAMARGRREYEIRVHKFRDGVFAVLFALAAALFSRATAIAGKPIFGYLAAICLIAACALSVPLFVAVTMQLTSAWLGRSFGPEALLASRTLGGSLRRTSVLVTALATAIAMMVSVGIMVGSFRETVIAWMERQLPADLYIRPAGAPAADRHPTLSPNVAGEIATVPGVAAIDRLRAYEIVYDGRPVTLAGVDLSSYRANRRSDFFSGRPTDEVFNSLRDSNNAIVSEPFAYKHHKKIGDDVLVPVGDTRAKFHIVDIYYDYSSERGEILMDRGVLLKYLSDPAPSNLAVYLAPGANIEAVRSGIAKATAPARLLIFSDREIRGEAIRIFDRTFVITYGLEAVAVVVAVMGIAGALLAVVIDRRRELALLRFVGASSRQIRKLIVVEAGLLGLLANVAGTVLGYFLSLILIFVINKQSFGWTIRFHWPVAIVLGALTFVFISTVLSGLYPAQIAVRLNPLEVIHED
jgi:putative ABC transport system permease protein